MVVHFCSSLFPFCVKRSTIGLVVKGGINVTYCRSCGANIEEVDGSFCRECGEQITTKEESVIDSTETVAQQRKKPMSFKSKVIIITCSALILIGILLFKIGETITSYDRVIDQLEEALNENDGKQLASLLNGTNNSLEINEQTVQGLLTYYDENPSERARLLKRLREEGQALEEGTFDSTEVLSLGTSGKKYLFFDRYMIEVEPVYFEVYTNYDQTTIAMNNEEIVTTTSEEFTAEYGPYVPGTYTFTASYASDYIELEEHSKVTHMGADTTEYVSLYLDGSMVEFNLDYSHLMEVDPVHLYLNGKDTGINVQEQHEVGPLLTDGSITVSYGFEAPWGSVMTEEEPIEYTHMGAGELVIDDTLQTEIQETIITYHKEELSAYTTMDADEITTATPNVVEQVMNNAEADESWGYYYAAEFLGINFYEDSFYLYTEQGTWVIEVGVDVIMNEVFSYAGDKDEELEYTENDQTYGLVFDEEKDKWLVSYVSNYNYVSDDQPIVYEEEEPPFYESVWETE